MRKGRIWVIAAREYLTLARTKSFIVGVLIGPLLMALAFFFLTPDDAPSESGSRTMVVMDHTGVVAEKLRPLADAAGMELKVESTVPVDDARRRHLNDALLDRTLAATVEIRAHALDGQVSEEAAIEIVSDTVTSQTVNWIRGTVRRVVQVQRLRAAGIEEDRAAALMRRTRVDIRAPGDEDEESDQTEVFARMIAPSVLFSLMFFGVMMTGPQLLQSTIEEKQQRISEVLLGSVSPFELMAGKLTGTVAVGLSVMAVYIGFGYGGLVHLGYAQLFPLTHVVLFLANLVVAMVMYGAIFLMVGAAANEIKDAQGMMTPVLLVLFVPVMMMQPIMGEPDGMLALATSMFPLSAPMIMPFRMSMATVPTWQIAVSLLGLVVATAGIIWAAGRVFRIGILARGEVPSLRELLGWIRRG